MDMVICLIPILRHHEFPITSSKIFLAHAAMYRSASGKEAITEYIQRVQLRDSGSISTLD